MQIYFETENGKPLVNPIKAAETLINSVMEVGTTYSGKTFTRDGKEVSHLFTVDELQEIAEYLLVYCKFNKGREE